jgi:multidrug efflux pump subunit AcrB
MPPGTSPERTNEVVARIEDLVGEMPHVRARLHHRGRLPVRGGATTARGGRGSLNDPARPGEPSGATCRPRGGWPSCSAHRRLGIPGGADLRAPAAHPRAAHQPGRQDVAISVQGDDLAELQRLGEESSGVCAACRDCRASSSPPKRPARSWHRDRSPARRGPGPGRRQVGQTVRTALDGTIVSRFTDRNNEYDIRVRLPRETLTSPENLGAIALFPGRQQPIYLRDIADLRPGPRTHDDPAREPEPAAARDGRRRRRGDRASAGQPRRARRPGRPVRCPTATRSSSVARNRPRARTSAISWRS